MAKHAHRLLLNQKKTWRCTLPGCRYFIHIGLAHILPGTESVCWQCGQEFTLSDESLEDEMPICGPCKNRKRGGPTQEEKDWMLYEIDVKAMMNKHGYTSVTQLNEGQRSALRAKGVPNAVMDAMQADEGLPKPRMRIVEKKPELNDEIEVIEPTDESEQITDEYPWLQGDNGDDEG